MDFKEKPCCRESINSQNAAVTLRLSSQISAGDWALEPEPTDSKNDPFHKPWKIQNRGPNFQVAGLSLANKCGTHLSAHVHYNTAKGCYHALRLFRSSIRQQTTALCGVFCETIVLRGCWHSFKDGQQQMKFHSSLLRAALDIKQLGFRSGLQLFCTC